MAKTKCVIYVEPELLEFAAKLFPFARGNSERIRSCLNELLRRENEVQKK